MEGTELNWRKSSYSGNGGGECVEIGAAPGAVVVRDTTDRTGPVLQFTPAAWRRFADQMKRSLVVQYGEIVARVVARRTCGMGAMTAIIVTGPWHPCRQRARSTGPGYF